MRDKGTVILTGGSRGVGAGTKTPLERLGYEVVAPPRRELNLLYPRAAALWAIRYLNISPPDAPLAGLILNAGTWPERDTYSAYEGQSNLFISHRDMLVACLPALERGRGSVVAVASQRALTGALNFSAYATMKAALVNLMQGYAGEYVGNARFFTVCPGWTDTEMGAAAKNSGGVSNPSIPPQDPLVVAQVIAGLIDNPGESGAVWVVNQGEVYRVAWQREREADDDAEYAL